MLHKKELSDVMAIVHDSQALRTAMTRVRDGEEGRGSLKRAIMRVMQGSSSLQVDMNAAKQGTPLYTFSPLLVYPRPVIVGRAARPERHHQEPPSEPAGSSDEHDSDTGPVRWADRDHSWAKPKPWPVVGVPLAPKKYDMSISKARAMEAQETASMAAQFSPAATAAREETGGEGGDEVEGEEQGDKEEQEAGDGGAEAEGDEAEGGVQEDGDEGEADSEPGQEAGTGADAAGEAAAQLAAEKTVGAREFPRPPKKFLRKAYQGIRAASSRMPMVKTLLHGVASDLHLEEAAAGGQTGSGWHAPPRAAKRAVPKDPLNKSHGTQKPVLTGKAVGAGGGVVDARFSYKFVHGQKK